MRWPGDGRIGWSPRSTSPSTTLPAGDRRRQRAQKIAVEAADLFAEQAFAERDLGLLDRRLEHDVEADDLGAALDDRAENAADLAGPGQRRRALERRRLIGFLVDRDHHRRRGGGVVPPAEHLPAQRRENVDRQAVGEVEYGRDGNRRADQYDGSDGDRVPRRAPDVQGLRPGKTYSIRSRRPTIGVGPGLAWGSTRNTIRRDANVAA